MEITIKGDKEFDDIPSLKSKALRINLNENIYGTFAEIGAGQETCRHFFRAGGASGTIAKAMSAYDKDFSDAIYGAEDDGRYVTEARLRKMLSHEMDLMENRLTRENNGDYNEIILHLRFKETDARLQQETLGVLGTNLIYGAFYKYNEPKKLLRYLYDHLDKDQLEIDTINFSGPVFKNIDNRLMSLQLVKNGMTDAVMFGPDGTNVLPAKVFYKKNILALRGSFRPVTKVNMAMYEKSYKMFINENKVDKDKTVVVFEITLSNLRAEGEIDEQDFIDRADLLCSLGQSVMISNFQEYFKVVEYFSKYTKARMGLAMGVSNLVDIFDEKYYRHISGGILEAFGKLFFKDLKVYLYPMLDPETGELINSENLKVYPRMKELYKFFKYNGKVIDIEEYDESIMNIFSREILRMITDGETGWEDMVPEGTAELIKDYRLFGYTRKPLTLSRKRK